MPVDRKLIICLDEFFAFSGKVFLVLFINVAKAVSIYVSDFHIEFPQFYYKISWHFEISFKVLDDTWLVLQCSAYYTFGIVKVYNNFKVVFCYRKKI